MKSLRFILATVVIGIASTAHSQTATVPESLPSWEVLEQEGTQLQAAGNHAKAVEVTTRALALAEQSASESQQLKSLVRLGSALWNTKRYAEAEPYLLRAQALQEKTGATESPEMARILNLLGITYSGQQRFDLAAPLYARALAIHQKNSNERSAAVVLQNVGEMYAKLKRFDEAEVAYRRSISIVARLQGGEHADVMRYLLDLGDMYQTQGRLTDALQVYNRIEEVRFRKLGPNHWQYAEALNRQGVIHAKQRRPATAEPLFSKAMTIWERALGPDHGYVAQAQDNLAGELLKLRQYDRAEKHYEAALKIRERAFGAETLPVAYSLVGLTNT
ncbi:MAG: tetratricopeptide repeat protein, partial [Ramlibacter sp.]